MRGQLYQAQRERSREIISMELDSMCKETAQQAHTWAWYSTSHSCLQAAQHPTSPNPCLYPLPQRNWYTSHFQMEATSPTLLEPPHTIKYGPIPTGSFSTMLKNSSPKFLPSSPTTLQKKLSLPMLLDYRNNQIRLSVAYVCNSGGESSSS